MFKTDYFSSDKVS